jgi:hypothetical protein
LLEEDVNERIKLFDDLGRLYRKRSQIAHGERTEYDFNLTNDSRRYLTRLAFRILNLIDANNLRTVSRKKDKVGESLQEYVEKLIFSNAQA